MAISGDIGLPSCPKCEARVREINHSIKKATIKYKCTNPDCLFSFVRDLS